MPPSSSPRNHSPTSIYQALRRRSSKAARPGYYCRTSARSSLKSPRSIAALDSTTGRSRFSRATPKRDYYCQSRRGNRLFELGLGEIALALCAVSSKTDQAEIARVLAEHGRDGFMAAWLRLRGAGWAADLIPELRNLETSS